MVGVIWDNCYHEGGNYYNEGGNPYLDGIKYIFIKKRFYKILKI